MGLSDPHRKKMLATTRGAAIALLDDLEYLRELLSRQEHPRGELRRLSNILRRLLVNNEVRVVAAPRISRFDFDVPDLRAFYKAGEEYPYIFFASGGLLEALNPLALTVMVQRVPDAANHKFFVPEFGKTTKMNADAFLTQKVICFKGDWVNRREAIKYVANRASGVHTDAPRNATESLLQKASEHVRYRMVGTEMKVDFSDLENIGLNDPDEDYSTNTLNPVLIELLVTAQFIVGSADAARLEDVIREEIEGLRAKTVSPPTS
jgi:hypothetical protein